MLLDIFKLNHIYWYFQLLNDLLITEHHRKNLKKKMKTNNLICNNILVETTWRYRQDDYHILSFCSVMDLYNLVDIIIENIS